MVSMQVNLEDANNTIPTFYNRQFVQTLSLF